MSDDTCLRCSTCSLSLPPEPEWSECPRCGEDTDPIKAKPNTTTKEATSILRAREFQEYLEKEGIA